MGESGAELSHGGVMILLMLILFGFVNECVAVAVILILIVTVCVLSVLFALYHFVPCGLLVRSTS